jgi:hypothetical protein
MLCGSQLPSTLEEKGLRIDNIVVKSVSSEVIGKFSGTLL